MDAEEIGRLIGELENRVERLRSLYEQYFMGIERLEPLTLRKDIDRRLWALRREQIRNTGLRFKLETTIQRYNTYQQYWARIVREIEQGTYQRDLGRAAQRFGDNVVTAFARRRQKMYEKGVSKKAEREARRTGPTASQAPLAETEEAPPSSNETFDVTFEDSDMQAPPSPRRPVAAAPEPVEPLELDIVGPAFLQPAPPTAAPAADRRGPPAAPAAPRAPLAAGARPAVAGLSPPNARPAAPAAFPAKPATPFATPAQPAVPIAASAKPPLPMGTAGKPPVPGPALGQPRPAPPATSGQPAPAPTAAKPAGPAAPAPKPAAPLTPATKPAAPAMTALKPAAPLTPAAKPAAPVAPPAQAVVGSAKPASPAMAPAAAVRPLSPTGATLGGSPPGARPAERPAAPPQRPAAASRPDIQPSSLSSEDTSLSPIRMRQIYGAFVEAKRRANESTASVTYEKIASNLETVAKELRAKHNARSVDFEVIMKNGKPVLKPVVKG